MAYPQWPSVSENYRAVSGGVECTMGTHYDIDLSVSEIGDTTERAFAKARQAIGKKVAQRRSFK